MSRTLTALAVVLACAAAGCAGSESASAPRWTERQAESITTVRSLPVRVLDCDGLGVPEAEGESRSYTRFRCVGGTRAAWQTYDTIAVRYEVRPLEEYDGPRTPHRLVRVRFIGGPGIP